MSIYWKSKFKRESVESPPCLPSSHQWT